MAAYTFVLLTSLIVFASAEDQKTPVEGRNLGSVYGYNSGYSRGGSYNNGYNGGHHGSNGGRFYNGGYGQGNRPKLSAIKLPYLDRNGCRFPGDVVCNTATDLTMYNYCVLADENKNLWKKPTMTTVTVTCTGTIVLTDFCNDNERLLRAAGLIQDKSGVDFQKKFVMSKYVVSLNPCIVVAP